MFFRANLALGSIERGPEVKTGPHFFHYARFMDLNGRIGCAQSLCYFFIHEPLH